MGRRLAAFSALVIAVQLSACERNHTAARSTEPPAYLRETLPPFRIRSGRTFRSVLHVVAAPPGRNVSPYWQVDSVPGIYRLHWVLHAAANSGHPGRVVDATSASFRLMMQ
jgi:hypothetical protein